MALSLGERRVQSTTTWQDSVQGSRKAVDTKDSHKLHVAFLDLCLPEASKNSTPATPSGMGDITSGDKQEEG